MVVFSPYTLVWACLARAVFTGGLGMLGPTGHNSVYMYMCKCSVVWPIHNAMHEAAV